MKTEFVVLTALFLAFGSVGFAQSTATPGPAKTNSGIRSVDFLNHSYQSSVCAEDLGITETVKVSDGKFAEAETFYNLIDNKVIYGDVNGDGSEEAVIQIICGSSAGTFRAFEVHVYTFQNGQAKLLGGLDSQRVERDYKKTYPRGFLVALAGNDAKIANGHVMVEALADGSNAGPKYIATFDYKWSAGKFVLSGKPARRPNK